MKITSRLVASFIFVLSLLILSIPSLFAKGLISVPSRGRVMCTVSIPDFKGDLMVSLYTLLGEKKFEKSVTLPKDNEKSFALLGALPENVYVVEAEGELSNQDDPPVVKKYSKAVKVTTDQKGNVSLTFGN